MDTDEWRQTAISDTVGVMRKHQQTTATMEDNDSPAATPRNSTASSKPSISAKFDSASAATPANVTARPSDSVQLKLDQYVAQPLINRTSCPMHWWAQHKPSYPILSSVAQTMLCMPATSVTSERVIFQSQRRITGKRNMLAPFKADTVIFLMDNL